MLARWTAGGVLLFGIICLGFGVHEMYFGECSERNGGCIPEAVSGGQLEPTPVVDNGAATTYFAIGGVMVVVGTIWLLINGVGDVKGSSTPSIPIGPTDMQIRAMAIKRQAEQRQSQQHPRGP